MKLKNLFISALAAMSVFSACSEKEEDLGAAGIKVDKTAIEYETSSSTQTLTLNATRDWSCNVAYDSQSTDKWLQISPSSGVASSKSQTIEITALANTGYDRTATVTFTIGLADAIVTVSQKGDKGEQGALTVSEFMHTDADEKTVYTVTGVASSNYSTSYNYIYITDGTLECEIYQPTNGAEWADKLKKGATITANGVHKTYTKSDGSTIEELYNGEILSVVEGESTIGEASGTGTEADPYNASAAIINASKLSSGTASTDFYYIKGFVKGTPSVSAAPSGYGNANFYIVDTKDATTDAFYCFQVMYLNGAKFTSDDQLKDGDEVVVYAQLYNYNGTPETNGKGSGKLVSINGEKGSGSDEDYTKAEAVTVADFISKADENTYYKLTGTVSSFSATYCSFDLTDATGKIYVYSVDNKADWTDKISNGGTVTLAGKYSYYSTNSQHEVVNAQILSFEAGETTTSTYEGLVVAVSSKAFLVKTSTGYAYAYDANTAPTVKVGDSVKLTGTDSEYNGLPEVTDYTVEVVSSGNPVTYPDAVKLEGTAMDSYTTIFGYVTFSGKLTVSGNYYNVAVTGATMTGSLSNATGIDAAMSGKIVDVTGYFIGNTGSGKYFNVIATSVKESADQSGADEGGSDDSGSSDASLTPGENEVLYLLSNSEISAVTKDASVSGTVYGSYDIASAAGNWTGNFAKASSNTFLQIRNNNASYLTSPEYSSKILRVVLVSTASKYNNTSDFTRNIYAVPVVDASKLPTGKDSNNKNITYTETEWSSNYGSAQFTSKGGAQNAEIKFNAETKQFSIISADGAVYIDAIYVFCAK